MISARLQIAVLSWSIGAVTIAALAAMAIAPPDYLRQSRYGVPHLTPAVLDPVSGEAVPADALVRAYKGEDSTGKVYY